MLTKIFHPNFSKVGEICVNTLKKDWSPEHTVKHVLCVIRCLLIEPNPESALNEEAGKLLLENYEDYHKRASMYTKIHATPQAEVTTTTAAVSEPVTSKSETLQIPVVAAASKPKHQSKKSITRL